MTGRSPAYADRILALGLQIEECVEGGDTVDTREGSRCRFGDVLQSLQRQVLVWVMILHRFQDAQQSSGPALSAGHDLIYEYMLPVADGFLSLAVHGTPSEEQHLASKQNVISGMPTQI
jgi:hypothetical protein